MSRLSAARSFSGEKGRPGAVAEQALAADSVGAVDTHGGVQAEAAAALPGEHVLDGGGLQQAAPLEEAKDAALEEPLEVVGIVACEMGGLVEADGAVRLLGEEAVQDHDVEVEVGVQAGAEAVQEGDGPQARVGPRPRAGAP